GADVEDLEGPLRLAAADLQSALHDGFRFGTRDQHGRVDGELEREELALAKQVGNRCVVACLTHELAKSGPLVLARRLVVTRVELDLATTQRLREQQLGREASAFDALLFEPGGRPVE